MKNKHLEGGLFDNTIRMPPNVEKFLSIHGNKKIIKLEVCRVPLWKILQVAGNILTTGGMAEALKKLNYDAFYHLFMLGTLEDGTQFLTEKNQFVVLKQHTGEKKSDARCMPVPRADNSNITLNELFLNALKNVGENNLWEYDAINKNCQRFITQLLSSSGLDYPRLRVWTNQNLKTTIQEDGILHKGLKLTTDIARALGFLTGKA